MEIFDIVDELGQPTGQTIERKEAHAKGVCHRTAHIWIVRMKDGRKQVLRYKDDSDDGRFCVPSGGLDLIRKYMRKKYEYQFFGWQQATVPALTEGDAVVIKGDGAATCGEELTGEMVPLLPLRGIYTPQDLYDALSTIWCEYTCAPRLRGGWSPANMTLGQCSITGFLVQDIFGGKVYGILRPGGNYHCYNVIDGHTFDLTSEQFGDEVLDYTENPEQFREVHFAKEEKRCRYEWLKAKLHELYS